MRLGICSRPKSYVAELRVAVKIDVDAQEGDEY